MFFRNVIIYQVGVVVREVNLNFNLESGGEVVDSLGYEIGQGQ